MRPLAPGRGARTGKPIKVRPPLTLLSKILLLSFTPFLLAGMLHLYQVQSLLSALDQSIALRLEAKSARIADDISQSLEQVQSVAARVGTTPAMADAVEVLDSDYLYLQGKLLVVRDIQYITFMDLEAFGVAQGHDEFGFGKTYDVLPEVMTALTEGTPFTGLRTVDDTLLLMSVYPVRKADDTIVGGVIVGINLQGGYFEGLAEKYGVRMRLSRNRTTVIGNAEGPDVVGWDGRAVNLPAFDGGKAYGLVVFEDNRAERQRLNDLRNQMLLFMGGSAVVLLGVAAVMVRRLLRPLRALVEDMQGYSRGERRETTLPQGSGEIRDMVRTYAMMKRENMALVSGLEEKVRERTADLEEKNREILDSITYAQRIQQALLPQPRQKPLALESVFSEFFVLWEPRDIVGGDIYFARPYDDGALVSVIDCTGHGVPGAFMTILAVEQLNTAIDAEDAPLADPAAVVATLNRQVFERINSQRRKSGRHDIRDGMDMALLAVDRDRTRFRLCGMGQSLFVHRDGVVEEIRGNRFGVGAEPELEKVKTIEVLHQQGATYYLVSDGYHDQRGGPKMQAMGKRRMKSILADVARLPMDQQKDAVAGALAAWQGEGERTDDVTVLGFRLEPAPAFRPVGISMEMC